LCFVKEHGSEDACAGNCPANQDLPEE